MAFLLDVMHVVGRKQEHLAQSTCELKSGQCREGENDGIDVDGGEFLVRFQCGDEPGAASFWPVSSDSSVVSDCLRGREDVDGQVGEKVEDAAVPL